MPFLQLTLDIGKADPTPFEDALFAAGATSVTLQDSADDPILEPAPGATPLWPTVTVKALFDSSANMDEITAVLSEHVGVLPMHRFERIEDRVWEREWLKDFKPMRFGERLWVCPGGMLPPEKSPDSEVRAEAPKHEENSLAPTPSSPQMRKRILIQLDPGLAFGTGTHPTTALCLEWLDSADLHGRRVIDYGCGSGILAIAALKLGARSAIGLDIDPQALLASRDNAERNEVSAELELLPVDADLPQTEIVLANILAGPLHELASKLASLVKPGGNLVLSGILKEQATDLARRYSAWFDMDEPAFRDGWTRLSGRRR